ncbi:MAG: hypothetical protein KAU01_02640 [Candidatus Cloacimonetes bacterium]|nr:hypothetical protein [Candidatus Cloacimonadota bacterium]
MKEYKPGKEYKHLNIFLLTIFWIYGALILAIPIYCFIKDGTIIDDSLSFIFSHVILYGFFIGLILYTNHRIYGIKASIDLEQIIYTNRKSTKTIPFNDVHKMKFIFYYNRSSIKIFTNTQKVRIYLVFKDAYEFVLEMKKGLDSSGKSAVYSHKKYFKFVRMVFNAEIMHKWVYKFSLIMIIGLLLLFAVLSVIKVTEAKIIIAISGYISIMVGSFIPVFIIQNRYKKETDKESFYFPPRDMEYEKTVVRKGFIILGIIFTVVIVFIMIV